MRIQTTNAGRTLSIDELAQVSGGHNPPDLIVGTNARVMHNPPTCLTGTGAIPPDPYLVSTR